MTVLTVEDLRTGFGTHAVLHGVSFEVHPGEITAILGLNGAGKSVTLQTISGLIGTWSGTIHFNGDDITTLETEDRVARGMAHVLQGRAVFPHLTVAENLRLGGAVLKDKAAVASATDRAYATFPRLKERRDQAAGSLSGGEQEMLAVGRALMSSPKLMLVDEASQGLAPKAVEHLFQTLKEVNESGVTILMVEQNVTFTLGIAHRVLVMQKGEIVYEGSSGELDRDLLASLLGIGALLGKRVLSGARVEAAVTATATEKEAPAGTERAVRRVAAPRTPKSRATPATGKAKPTPKQPTRTPSPKAPPKLVRVGTVRPIALKPVAAAKARVALNPTKPTRSIGVKGKQLRPKKPQIAKRKAKAS